MTDDSQMKVRLPAALKRRIEKASAENKRTLNGEIVARLEASFQHKSGMERSGATTSNDLAKQVEELSARLKAVEDSLVPDFTRPNPDERIADLETKIRKLEARK